MCPAFQNNARCHHLPRSPATKTPRLPSLPRNPNSSMWFFFISVSAFPSFPSPRMRARPEVHAGRRHCRQQRCRGSRDAAPPAAVSTHVKGKHERRCTSQDKTDAMASSRPPFWRRSGGFGPRPSPTSTCAACSLCS